ncbi:MAG TPA: NINE protein [Ktedonobacterales bacterium]|nr:NINE protein [Ktedonobacterales bacterium]
MSVDLAQLTAHLSPEQQEVVKKAYRKKAEHPTAAFLWCFFLGTCGAHRFYLRQWGAGLARLIIPVVAALVIVLGIVLQWPPASVAAVAIALLLIALIWEIIDLFRIDHEVYERNLKLAEDLIASTVLADRSVEQKALGRMGILMDETEQASTGAAQREERQTAAEAAAVVPEPVAAIGEAAAPGTIENAEEVQSHETESAGAGAASAHFVAHTVNEISADPNDTQHGEPLYSPQHSWSETGFVHAEDERAQTGTQAGEETLAEPGALGVAAAGVGAAAVGGFALDELVTHRHEETDHSATDSLETFSTLGAAEGDAANVEPPSPAESEALTWPDHPPLQFDEPAPASQTPADFTDMGTVPEAAPPVADIEGAAPLFVTLPGYTHEASAEAPALQVAPAPDAAPATDDALLLLMPDAAMEPPAFDAEPLSSAVGEAPSPESYIPPTVPVVSAPFAEETGPIMPPAVAEPEPELEPAHSDGQTLAELGALAGGVGLAAGAAEMLHAHHAAQPEPTPEPAMEPLGGTAPATIEEPVAPAPAPEPVVEAAPAPPAQHRLRRVREYLQVKRGDEAGEELVAEELIEVDEDPEPVRERLRAQLRQQAIERGLE